MVWLAFCLVCATSSSLVKQRRLATTLDPKTSPEFTSEAQRIYPNLILTTTDTAIQSAIVSLVFGADKGTDKFSVDSACTSALCLGATTCEDCFGQLILTGPSSAEEFQNALRHVAFQCSKAEPTPLKYVSVQVTTSEGKRNLSMFLL